jgi:hypothetical protein
MFRAYCGKHQKLKTIAFTIPEKQSKNLSNKFNKEDRASI